MTKVMNHSEYIKKTKTMTDSQLSHVIDDCRQVIELQSDFNPNIGYYMDEMHYCAMELNARSQDRSLST